MKWGFRILLNSAMLCMTGYAIMTSIFSHYAIHVEPCNDNYYECPELVRMIYVIRILQVCMYLAYSICAALMCLFAYKMHQTIKETYENWEMSCFEIFLHCFALVFPVCVLTAILCTGKGNMLEQDSEQAKKHGDKELRDFNILLYFLLECAKAVIYSILLYIVTKYSTEKKRQEVQQNEYLNETTEAFIQEMNNRTSGMIENALHETDVE